MNDLDCRWFDPAEIQSAVRTMWNQCRRAPAGQVDAVQQSRRKQQTKTALIAGGGALVFVVLVIGGLLLFAEPEAGKKPKYGPLAALCLTVIGGAGIGVYYLCGANNQQRAKRDAAFEQLSRNLPGLRPAGRTEFEADFVGTVPWYMTEEWIHAYGLAAGSYQGEEIVVVECTHVIDPVLATTDSRVMQGLSGLVANKHKRLYLRAMEATVFAGPLENVSDMLFVPQTDPSRAYYKRALRQQDCNLADVFNLPRALRKKYWMAAADPDACGDIFASQLPDLLAARKWCIVQVVGGHCVVITSHWHGNFPGRAPNTAEAIEDDLTFAHAVYRQLKQISQGGAGVSEAEDEFLPGPTPDFTAGVAAGEAASFAGNDIAGSTALATAVAEPAANVPPRADYSADVAKVAQAARPRTSRVRRRRPHSLLAKTCLVGIGFPLFLFCLLATLGLSLERHRGLAAGDWPQTDARVTDSRTDIQIRHRDGQEVKQFKPLVSYEYEVGGARFTGKRLEYGLVLASMDKQQADLFLAKYQKGAAVNVHYLAEHPDVSVLEPGLQEESTLVIIIWVMGAFALVGMLMCVWAVIGKRVRPAC